MPTRKQRRRRAKEHRHEYVWEDEEGNEIEAPDVARKESTAPRKPPPRSSSCGQPDRQCWFESERYIGGAKYGSAYTLIASGIVADMWGRRTSFLLGAVRRRRR